MVSVLQERVKMNKRNAQDSLDSKNGIKMNPLFLWLWAQEYEAKEKKLYIIYIFLGQNRSNTEFAVCHDYERFC